MKEIQKIQLTEKFDLLNDSDMKDLLGGSGTSCHGVCAPVECSGYTGQPGTCAIEYDFNGNFTRCYCEAY
ncbi:hypothetical protein LJC43_00970 [Parabacteroides sp. OttesenSCG-928-G21]|nr:hypothetical protein [Parabacteroides sp. OttesenSCG-928-G21]